MYGPGKSAQPRKTQHLSIAENPIRGKSPALTQSVFSQPKTRCDSPTTPAMWEETAQMPLNCSLTRTGCGHYPAFQQLLSIPLNRSNEIR
jgi:hypothetical protein